MGKEIIEQIKTCQRKSGFPSVNYLREKKFSYSYIRYRILRPIIKVMYYFFRKRHYPSPWLSPAATLFFEEWLKKDQKMAEFGSGLSTVFFASRMEEVVSIEHYKPWHEKVVALFEEKGLKNVDYRLITEVSNDDFKSDEALNHLIRLSDSKFQIKESFQPYYRGISDKPDGYFDVVLVDGRARPECVFSSIEKLKSGGLMVLDNSERKRYEVIFAFLKEWMKYTTTNGLTDTTFWIKP